MVSYDKESFLSGLAVGRQMKGWDGKGFAFQPFEAPYYMRYGTSDGRWILPNPGGENGWNGGAIPMRAGTSEFLKVDWGQHNFEIKTVVKLVDLTYASFAYGAHHVTSNGPIDAPFCAFTSNRIRGFFQTKSQSPSISGSYAVWNFIDISGSEIPIQVGLDYGISYKSENGMWTFKVTQGSTVITRHLSVGQPFYVETNDTVIMFGCNAEPFASNLSPIKIDLHRTSIFVDGAPVWGRTNDDS